MAERRRLAPAPATLQVDDEVIIYRRHADGRLVDEDMRTGVVGALDPGKIHIAWHPSYDDPRARHIAAFHCDPSHPHDRMRVGSSNLDLRIYYAPLDEPPT